MKEHGLQLSEPMAIARQAKRKTQTRRIMTMYNSVFERLGGRTKAEMWALLDLSRPKVKANGQLYVPFKPEAVTLNLAVEVKPRVAKGDRIWWKETTALTESDGGPVVAYRAGGTMMHCASGEKRFGNYREFIVPGEPGQVYDVDRWTPSLLMHRWKARYVDTVISVRAERLQDITEADAIAEGVERVMIGSLERWKNYAFQLLPDESNISDCVVHDPVTSYATLIDSLHGAGTWKKNELVWVYEFEHG